MNQSEINTVVKLRAEGMKFTEIADKIGLSVDSVKRRFYASKQKPTKSLAVIKTPEPKQLVSKKAKVVFFDIEVAPTRGWVWQHWESNLIAVDKDWFMLSFSYKWEGTTKIITHRLCDYKNYHEDLECDLQLVKSLWDVLNECDIAIAHNGDAYDVKKFNARCAMLNIKPPAPYRTIDTLKMARRYFKFGSNKLNDLGMFLQVGEKLPHTGAHLWFSCMRGDKKSWDLMKKYNEQDVRLLESVYQIMKPFHTTHPNMNVYTGEIDCCPKCTSKNIQRRGFFYTNAAAKQRFQCTDCSSWFSGKKENVSA